MNLNFYDFESLEEELEKLPPLHRIAFAASGCEGLLPNYNAFSREENWGDPSILRKALDEVWQILRGKPIDVNAIEKLKVDCDSDDLVPHSEDFAGYVIEARGACIAVYHTLSACINFDTATIVEAIKRLAYAIELSEDLIEELNVDLNKLEYSEYIQTIARHPFAVREMAKQNEDLQRLKEAKTLEPEL